MNASTEMIDIGHASMAHRQTGTGPDVVFVHGWPLHGDTWNGVVGHLDGFTCHVLDLPGCGASTTTEATPLTMTGHVDSVGAAIDELGLEQFSLVGHDSGGLIARMVAARRADDVASLVIAGSEIPGHHPWQVALFGLLAKLPGSSAIMRTVLSHDSLMMSPFALGGSFSDPARISADFMGIVGSLLEDEEALSRQLEIIGSFDNAVVDGLVDVHAELTMPTLLIWGEDDGFFPVEKAQAMTTQFAGPTTFEVVPDAKLFVHEEHPERFAELVAGFLGAPAAVR